MNKVSIIKCNGCGNAFEKLTKYVKQSANRGMMHYCSRSCCAKHTLKEKFHTDWNTSEKNKEHLRQFCKNKIDEYTPFRVLFRCCKKRKNKECDLDISYLKELWEYQEGKCAISGVKLVLEQNYNKNFQASIDRIDSSKGYIKGNIRYTSVSINWLKSNLNDEHLTEFIGICKRIR